MTLNSFLIKYPNASSFLKRTKVKREETIDDH